jgi:hypothetical protein
VAAAPAIARRRAVDRREGDAWTIREIAFHIEESTYYADAVGDLRPA